jgi:acetyl/propionyl-CoA carboxylase alpha subunit
MLTRPLNLTRPWAHGGINMITVEFQKNRHKIYQCRANDKTVVMVDGETVFVQPARANEFIAEIDGQRRRIWIVAHGEAIYAQMDGRAFRFDRIDTTRTSVSAAGAASEGAALAPMPGVVASVLVAAGQAVARGEALLVIESMKMLITVEAAMDGIVAALPLVAGQNFARGALLALIQDKEVQA